VDPTFVSALKYLEHATQVQEAQFLGELNVLEHPLLQGSYQVSPT
jgi:hypothetical protein